MNLFNTIFYLTWSIVKLSYIFYFYNFYYIYDFKKLNFNNNFNFLFNIFSFFKFWHGDGVGSRYLAYILLFIHNICYKLRFSN